MPLRLLLMPLYNVAESIVDACRDQVQPTIGSILYCDLAFGYMDHSGVYVGNNEIIHLSRNGHIESVTPKEFISGGTACSIYVSCYKSVAVGSEIAAKRAKNMLGRTRNYNVILDNCHQFSVGCLTGDFDNTCNFLWTLKDRAKKELHASSWRYWNIKLFD